MQDYRKGKTQLASIFSSLRRTAAQKLWQRQLENRAKPMRETETEFKQSVAKARKANPFRWLTLTPLPPFTAPLHSLHSLGARIIERKTLRRNNFGFSCRLAHNFLACLRSVVGLLAFGHFICCCSLFVVARDHPPALPQVSVCACAFVPAALCPDWLRLMAPVAAGC